jgi:hypothetical protein
MKTFLKISTVLLTGVVLSIFLFVIRTNLDDLQKKKENSDEFFYVPSGEFLKVASLGYNKMLADLYWLKALQHIGDNEWESAGYPHLFPILDLVTDLDPQFEYAYEVGGVVLSVYTDRIAESNKLLKKGVSQDLQAWELPFYLGFNHFYYMEDYEKAAFYMSKAAKTPNRPAYVPRLAARLYVEAGSANTALDFLISVKESTKDERVKEELDRKIKEVAVERDIVFLENAIKQYKKRYYKAPQKLDYLLSKGILDRLPVEPLGGYYFLDSETGEVKSSTIKERMRLYKSRRLKN